MEQSFSHDASIVASKPLNSQSENRKEVKSIWMNKQRETLSDESIFDSDGTSLLPDINSELFDLDVYFKDQESTEIIDFEQLTSRKNFKLQIVKLDSISISPTEAQPQQIVNLKQSFNFSAVLKPTKQSSTQTSKIDLMKRCQQTSNDQTVFRHFVNRPTSLPPENAALANLEKRVKADVKPTLIGDGDKREIFEKDLTNELGLPDLEFGEGVTQSLVPYEMIQNRPTRQATPKFRCKKNFRPQTKYMQKRVIVSRGNALAASKSNKSEAINRVVTKKETNILSKTPGNVIKNDVSADASKDYVFNTSGSQHAALSSVVEKLQHIDWETCIAGLRSFVTIASKIDWDSEIGHNFIAIISRKLIAFIKSPRSNLCRTACQTTGEFFLLTKSTKRPEFDDMVDVLLCKTADPNRFIQKDANDALDKMVISICVHHSVRAICSKGPDHKNSVVRASTARLLYHISKHAGLEAIVGSDANPRTRKRVLENLAKFLIDKNQETRRQAEKLCKILKRHKFFIEYFFKDIENDFKNPLRKIIDSIKQN